MSLVLRRSELDTVSLVVASPGLRKGPGSSPLDWLETLLLMQPRIPLVLDVHQGTLALHRGAFHLGGPQHILVLEVFLPVCGMGHLPLLNFMRFMSDHFSSLMKSHWMAA